MNKFSFFVLSVVFWLVIILIYTTYPANAQMIFQENFEDPSRVTDNWSPYGSSFTVVNGVGVLRPDGSIVPIWWNHKATMHDKGDEPIIFGDLIYEVDVKMTSARRTLLLFGSDAEDRQFWVGYDISSAQLHCCNHLENNSRSPGSCTLIEDYRPYDGQWHRWKIEVNNSQFDFYVDDHHVITGQLDGYLPGPIGMRSWDSGGTQFDNLVAFELVPEPIASFTYLPQSPFVGEEISFDASSSHDPDGEIVSYSWDFGDGHTATGQITTHTYSEDGIYLVTLTVIDDDEFIKNTQTNLIIGDTEPPTGCDLTPVFDYLDVIDSKLDALPQEERGTDGASTHTPQDVDDEIEDEAIYAGVTAIGGKLDDETRFTSDAELEAHEFKVINALIDQAKILISILSDLNNKIGILGGKVDDLKTDHLNIQDDIKALKDDDIKALKDKLSNIESTLAPLNNSEVITINDLAPGQGGVRIWGAEKMDKPDKPLKEQQGKKK